ncbi:MAG: energy-dependent translational throttle protein EttA [Puniceicoccales bacterium]|jgi:ATP-binding cassette ChvD family protein|nr:energy-dependent translational throttle protein EttA [Puniceicoccales bacterium]
MAAHDNSTRSANAPRIIYTMTRVSKSHEKKPIIKDISLSFFHGAKIGVLGLNGSGKSTLLRIMAGVDTQYDGQISRVPGYSIGYLEQEPLLGREGTVQDVVEEAVAPLRKLLEEYDETFEQVAEASGAGQERILARQAEIQEILDAKGAWDLDSRMEQALDALRCPLGETLLAHLSGGERRRVALCRLLLQNPDILLLDEPTNHLDAETVGWLEQHLQRHTGTVIAVTHDRYFLDNVAGWILELDRGHGIPWRGNYTGWLEQKQRRLAVEEKVATARQRALAREREWALASPKARTVKNKARIRAYESLLGADPVEKERGAELFIPPGPRLGGAVATATDLTKSLGGKLLFDRVNFSIPPGAIVGVIGPNGAGKTTLLRMLLGQEKPDAGTLTLGETVKLACVEQSRESLDDAAQVWQAMSDGEEMLQLGKIRVNARAYAARYGFTGADQQKQVGKLSGGERNRVHLARMLRSGANVILLDEPTNDLDVNTIRALEDALLDFAGCALIVSHDRWFLDRVATHILAFEGDSVVVWHEGNYQSYEEDRRRRLGPLAERPHRLKYRRLTR